MFIQTENKGGGFFSIEWKSRIVSKEIEGGRGVRSGWLKKTLIYVCMMYVSCMYVTNPPLYPYLQLCM